MNAHVAAPAEPGMLGTLLELGKSRLSIFVLITTMVGYIVAARGAFEWRVFLAASVGTMLSALGANGMNQWWESDRDREMKRTAGRPIPSGRLSRTVALWVSTTWCVAGVVLLEVYVNRLTALLSLFVILLYVLVYTPTKVRTSVSTLIGAVVGAIPPMMGWTAAANRIDAGAWMLFGVLFLWQIPHFLALAWMYRDDYEKGGYRMLPFFDPDGRLTTWMTLLYSVCLIPVGLSFFALGLAGPVYAVGSTLAAAAMVYASLKLIRSRSVEDAKRVFFGSLIYLPVVLVLLAIGY